MSEQQHDKNWRPVFIVSDGTAITAETLAHSVMTQFPDLVYDQQRIPFIDTPEKAHQVAKRIERTLNETGVRPLVFSTFVDPEISKEFLKTAPGFQVELFRSFVGPMERELGMKSTHTVSDGTAITAETLAHSVMTQFPDLVYDQQRIPFIDTPEKAHQVAKRIERTLNETGVRPLVFSTFVDPEISKEFLKTAPGFQVELFRSFVGPMERELGMKSTHTVGATHKIRNEERYNKRIAAIDYTLTHDDGQTNRGLDQAEVILVGVSRSGKTPTSLFLAMQFGIKVANYPLIPEDFDRGELPPALEPLRDKLFGLSIKPERLSEIRNERRPGSHYASIENCRKEIEDAEKLMRRNGIEWLNSTTKSIEEIAATIIAKQHLEKLGNN